MAIDVLAGPGCLGVKRADADALLAELGDDAVLIDSTSIYRSLGGKAASPESDSQLFRVARVMAGAAVRQANEQGNQWDRYDQLGAAVAAYLPGRGGRRRSYLCRGPWPSGGL